MKAIVESEAYLTNKYIIQNFLPTSLDQQLYIIVELKIHKLLTI